MIPPLQMLFALILGHYLCDFALQSEWMSRAKNRHVRTDPPPGQTYQAHWYHVLAAHSMIHAIPVWLITGLWWLGLVEAILHFGIDFLKCDGHTSIDTDQTLHLFCKVVYLLISISMAPTSGTAIAM